VRTSRALPAVLLAFAAGHLLLGLLMAFAPGTFFEEIGPYPPQNDHYIRDVSTFYLALGTVVLIAWRLRSWRTPVIAFGLIQYALHAVNHLVDIGDTDPEGLGPVNFATIALTAAALGWMLKESRKEEAR
jgi:peptidoglycan/LPS O-acetylase OafA/YrhL